MFHHNPLFRCYFGNEKDALDPKEYLALSEVQDILTIQPFSSLKKAMSLSRLVFLRQTHSVDGLHVSENPPYSFAQTGDYLITNQKFVGLGVMTADCLPIIMVDPVRGAIGIAHAGWRGTVAHIGTIMLDDMRRSFGTQPEHLKVFFGPSAKQCCYKVSAHFINELEHLPEYEQLLIKRHGTYYFDNTQCNRMLLETAGIHKDAICCEYNLCTICDKGFYSHRRGQSNRQMTVVSLV